MTWLFVHCPNEFTMWLFTGKMTFEYNFFGEGGMGIRILSNTKTVTNIPIQLALPKMFILQTL